MRGFALLTRAQWVTRCPFLSSAPRLTLGFLSLRVFQVPPRRQYVTLKRAPVSPPRATLIRLRLSDPPHSHPVCCACLLTAALPRPNVDYREAAAKFQKEWHVHEPHRHFDFARHVKSHSLVSVVNKGLCYHALEREHARKLVSAPLPAHARRDSLSDRDEWLSSPSPWMHRFGAPPRLSVTLRVPVR